MNDHEVVCAYLDNAEMLKDRGDNEFGHGYWIGRALSHSEQNAIDPAWLVRQMDKRGLDSALVPVPKIEAARG